MSTPSSDNLRARSRAPAPAARRTTAVAAVPPHALRADRTSASSSRPRAAKLVSSIRHLRCLSFRFRCRDAGRPESRKPGAFHGDGLPAERLRAWSGAAASRGGPVVVIDASDAAHSCPASVPMDCSRMVIGRFLLFVVPCRVDSRRCRAGTCPALGDTPSRGDASTTARAHAQTRHSSSRDGGTEGKSSDLRASRRSTRRMSSGRCR